MRRLEGARERMDAADLDPAVLADDFDRIEAVNRWLGGVRSMRASLAGLVRPGAALTVLDVGSGSGDVARALAVFASRVGCHVRIVTVDWHAMIVALARSRTPRASPIVLIRADGLALPFRDGSFDVAMMSLALHHFEAGARARMLCELVRVARRRVIINDLERCWPNYLGARLLSATLWRTNPLARYDGPVSVLRSFTGPELRGELSAAGLEDVTVARHFFYRLVASGTPRHA